jgi:hypothetical protein
MWVAEEIIPRSQSNQRHYGIVRTVKTAVKFKLINKLDSNITRVASFDQFEIIKSEP